MRRSYFAVLACMLVVCNTLLFVNISNRPVEDEVMRDFKIAFKRIGDFTNRQVSVAPFSTIGYAANNATKKEKSNDQEYKQLRVQHSQQDSQSIGTYPTREHENLLRKVNDDVVELLYSIERELKQISVDKNGNVSNVMSRLSSQQRAILIDIEELGNLDDDWKKEEAKSLQDLVRKRINYIQNPADCKTSKQLLCTMSTACGFGCQVQNLVFCLMIAYGTKRTMILQSKGWNYEPNGWEVLFRPVSDTCHEVSANPQLWAGERASSDIQVISLPSIYSNKESFPPYIPLGIPEDLAPRIMRLHGNPAVWWIGQMMSYLLRPEKNLNQDIDNTRATLGFQKPVVGIHVRRTDKLISEASYHGIEEYMKHVEAWYEKYELRRNKNKTGEKITRRVYLASDDTTVLPEAREKYPNYVFISDPAISQSANVNQRYTSNSLRGAVLDIHFLSSCDYIVCTLSSGVCRVAYGLMQNYHSDASSLIHSLDDIFYYGIQHPHEQVAVYDHKAKSDSEELDLLVGDIIGIHGNHWDGFSKGRNYRTGLIGLYPSHKVKEVVKVIKYPTYPEVPAG